MVGPSVFPEKQVISEWLVLQYFQIHGFWKCLVLQYFQVHGSSKCLVLQYFQIHRLYQNGWSFSISRFTGKKSSFETQNWLFRTDFKSETTSKYILDIPWVSPAHFSYIKHDFWRKIGKNQFKNEQNTKTLCGPCSRERAVKIQPYWLWNFGFMFIS